MPNEGDIMSSKTKFAHVAPNGHIYMRQSARAYTHVVLRRNVNAVQLAAAKMRRSAEVDYAAKSAAEHWKHCEHVIAVGVGGQAQYTRDQGGYGSGRTWTVDQSWFDFYNAYIIEHGTLEAYVAKCRAQAEECNDNAVAAILKQSEDFYVASWHHSEALAEKACGVCRAYETRVEAINNGVRA